jgi:hypothetical protein
MDPGGLGNPAEKLFQETLGYLNYSSGASDPRFLANVNQLFGELELQQPVPARRPRRAAATGEPTWQALGRSLADALTQLHGQSEAFRQVEQAEAVLRLVFQEALPGYRRHHRDLLFHQTEESLFGPLFIGRMCEMVLRQGGPWSETERIVSGAIRQINDYVGHRPVAALRSQQKLQPYPHEWVRPIPLFIRGTGVAAGRYHDVVQLALEILEKTDPALREQACFHPEWLDEMALDPRAYDFDHPANKRPNYHFGQWDPNQIDNSGRYRRFVIQQVTLDAMLDRLKEAEGPKNELLYEAAAVLAGTVLMAAGVSGTGPNTHDSNTSLATLLPQIADYRDRFYEQLLQRMSGAHGKRLRAEAENLRQPFGGARQHLNQELARRRARQLQHTHLAQFYAWMGYTDAAMRQVEVVPVTSARMSCQIYCLLTSAHVALDRGQREPAAAVLPEVEELLLRGIDCGALADPWNILGFGGQYSLFPSVENSIHDHRVDELIQLVSQVFGLYTRLQKSAAAAGDAELPARLAGSMEKLAIWWDKYASPEVSDVEGFSGRQAWESAVHVASVLRDWHAAGTAAGDVAFWQGHLDRFQSAKAYALVVESLLEQRDLVAAMALLIQWLGQSLEIPLEEPDYSFHELVLHWMDILLSGDDPKRRQPDKPTVPPEQRWPLARKLLDYLEANAEEYWDVPTLELSGGMLLEEGEDDEDLSGEDEEDDEDEADDRDGLFAAAYEEVTFRDSANDGVEGEMIQGGGEPATDFELSLESERIIDRLTFTTTLAQLWKAVASSLGTAADAASDREGVLSGWLAQANTNLRRLGELLHAVHAYPIVAPQNTQLLMEYDRRRSVKEELLEEIIATCVETADARRSLSAAIEHPQPNQEVPGWEASAQQVLRAVFRGDRKGIRAAWPALHAQLTEQPLLYVALGKGGNPLKIVASRSLQRVLRRLLAYLPRLGMLEETYRLLETIQEMEQKHAVGPGAITEFDQMFAIGCRGIVRSLTISAQHWRPAAGKSNPDAEMTLIGFLERTVEALLRCWLDHSRRVRLSVLEALGEENRWKTLKRFIETYGHELFSQKFMNLGNLRAILHEGVDAYLQWLAEETADPDEIPLLRDLDRRLPRDEAVRWLELAIEAVAENYAEYVDYNSTTTQSDRGEMLYTLLDFLRLQTSYNRVAWNLRPVMMAHETLVRCGCPEAAEIWRQAVTQRTTEIAQDHLRRFGNLSRQYGMRLPSIAERLEERFVRPLSIDRLRALVEPAIEQLREGAPPQAFDLLRKGIGPLTDEPAGVGFEVPRWLEALEQEVEQLRTGPSEDEDPLDPYLPAPEVHLTKADADRQIRNMGR